MNNKCYRIKCITNLHVGDGEANYNIIDNEIERDPVNHYPIIFSSGVKGALRDHLKDVLPEEKLRAIFGAEAKTGSDSKEAETEKGKQSQQSKPSKASVSGKVKFMNAILLATPMRASSGKRSYYLVTTPGILLQLLAMEESFDRQQEIDKIRKVLKAIEKGVSLNEKNIAVEGYPKIEEIIEDDILKGWLEKWVGEEELILLPDSDFRQYRYPVQARNKLENGESKSLWYEEYVPHEAIFYTYFLSTGTEDSKTALEDLAEVLKDHCLVQFGGNATIGFGLTRMTEMEGWKDE